MVFDSLLLRQDRCLSSSHLSCLNSRHLSCLNRRHLSCLNRRRDSCRPPAGCCYVFCSGKLWLCLGVRCLSGAPRRGLTWGEESEEGGSVSIRGRTPSLFGVMLAPSWLQLGHLGSNLGPCWLYLGSNFAILVPTWPSWRFLKPC